MRADQQFRSIPGILRANGQRFGARVALSDRGYRVTFAELEAQMVRVGRAVRALGIAPGDRVALWAPNSAGWVAAALGVLATGAWLVPLNTRFKGEEAAYVLDKSEAAALITVADFLGLDFVQMLGVASPETAARTRTVLLHDSWSGAAPSGPAPSGPAPYGPAQPGPAQPGPAPPPGVLAWEDFLAGGEAVAPDQVLASIDRLDPGDVSDVMFTSGTTARPKGVMLTHGSSLRSFEAWNGGFGLGEGDRMVVTNPFFHCFGYKAGWMLSLMVGATVYPMAVFEPGVMLEMIASERISMLPGPPTVFTSILDHPRRDGFDLSSLRVAFVGASTVPVELIHRLQRELPFRSVTTGYGLTEATAMVSNSAPGDDPETVARWSGQVVEGVEVKVVDEAGDEVATGQEGEILVRGFNIMRGYLGDPDGTRAVIDDDGWLHTGDIGYVNEGRYIKITDRKKDIYICGGFNVAPAEVENVLLSVPWVQQAAVVGRPDARLGEVGVAFVVPRPGAVGDPDELIAFARGRLANYKVPREVRLVDGFPLNASGKVLKTELRAGLADGAAPAG